MIGGTTRYGHACAFFALDNRYICLVIFGNLKYWKMMQDPKARTLPSSPRLSPLTPRRYPSGEYSVWNAVPPQADESLRWAAADGRWVSVTLGDGLFAGQVEVRDSAGVFERVDSYEAALKLAQQWRTF